MSHILTDIKTLKDALREVVSENEALKKEIAELKEQIEDLKTYINLPARENS